MVWYDYYDKNRDKIDKKNIEWMIELNVNMNKK